MLTSCPIHPVNPRAASRALLPDDDRNGLWDETDLTAAVNKERFNFWRNDDRDGGRKVLI